MTTKENVKVNVKGGRYKASKSINGNVYKVIETDIEFYDDRITLSKGSGLIKGKNKITTEIMYKSISSVTTKRKCSSVNIIISCAIAIAGLLTGIWLAFLLAIIPVFVGTTAMVAIEYSEGIYDIPTEFKSDAEELQAKINMAINQSK